MDESQERRFWLKVRPETNGCWIWIGSNNGQSGHGKFSIQHKPVQAHRISYEHFIGRILDGLEIDHLCRNPPCVNPTHLEPVTHKENLLRGNYKRAGSARRAMTHCKRGHEFTEANIRWKNNHRQCRICQREEQRRKRNAHNLPVPKQS